MSGIRLSPRHASFEPGYNAARWIPIWIVWPITRRSAVVRRLFIDLPPTRFRMAFLARYYWFILDALRKGSLGDFVPAVHPDAKLELFSVGTYVGGQAWGEALMEFLASFDDLDVELRKFIDIDGRRFLSIAKMAGKGSRSGIDVGFEFALEVQTRDGWAVYGRLYRTTAEAFEAVGLSE